jgi:hypothetical protein
MDFSFKITGWRFGFWLLTGCLMQQALAQEVEHNYPVGPQNTNCDSLKLAELPFQEVISTLENTSFRFDQGFRISRISGVRAAHYYSCNGIVGYLILTIGQEKKVFIDVPKSLWNEFITTSDLDGFYEKNIKSEFREYRE